MSMPIVLSGKGDTLKVLNDLVTVVVSGEETDGKYAVLESITQPKDGVPLLHTHPHYQLLISIIERAQFFAFYCLKVCKKKNPMCGQ